MGALQIRYPKDKFKVYLLDDGGSVQKRHQDNDEKSREAWLRRKTLKDYCKKIGAIYHTRQRNEHAKAGNLNSVLPHSNGELLVIFDADHVPTADFWENTVGLFQEDPRLYLAQTPHFFVNADPRDLRISKRRPGYD